jgi:serine/threonine-protein kinase
MGEVWRADHVTLGTAVAVKLVDTANRDDAQETLARFQLEARAAAQLKSPHVVQILDYGADGRVAFIAMEYLEGESLEQRLERRGWLLPSEVAHILREMARAVDRAHAAGIIHRDLKPPNVFLARVDGMEVVKVLDFGIAKMLGQPRDVHLQTQAGFVVGTPAYMSPEQVLGKAVDHRSDLWQMGLIAFECMTGRRPFDGTSLGQLFMSICTLPLPVPSVVAATPLGEGAAAAEQGKPARSSAPPDTQVPPAFDAWFARAASRDPAQRFQSAGEMAEALVAILSPGGAGESAIPTVSSPLARPAPQPPAALPTGRNEAWSTGRSEIAPPRRATPASLVAALIAAPVGILCLGLLWYMITHRTAAPAVAIDAPTASAQAAPPAPSAASTTAPAAPSATATATAPPDTAASAAPPAATASDAAAARPRPGRAAGHATARRGSPSTSGSDPMRVAIASTIVLAAALGASPARADGPDAIARATARRLGQEAVKLFDAGDYAGALEKFNTADSLVPAPTLGLYAARCLVKLGRIVEASERYLEVTRMQLDRYAPPVMRKAQADAVAEREKLVVSIPSLEVRLTGPLGAGVDVSVDGKALLPALLGERRPIDPGKHTVDAKRADTTVTKTVTIAPAETSKLVIEMPPLPPDPVPRMAPLRVAGWVGVGVGGAGVVAGAIAGLVALAKGQALLSQCPGHVCSTPGMLAQAGSYDAARTASTAGFVGGAIALAAGVTLVLVSPRQTWVYPDGRPAPPPAAPTAPPPAVSLDLTLGGASLRGIF